MCDVAVFLTAVRLGIRCQLVHDLIQRCGFEFKVIRVKQSVWQAAMWDTPNKTLHQRRHGTLASESKKFGQEKGGGRAPVVFDQLLSFFAAHAPSLATHRFAAQVALQNRHRQADDRGAPPSRPLQVDVHQHRVLPVAPAHAQLMVDLVCLRLQSWQPPHQIPASPPPAIWGRLV